MPELHWLGDTDARRTARRVPYRLLESAETVGADAGATAVIQPGGSMRDDEVINAANERDVAMVMTGMRHFRH